MRTAFVLVLTAATLFAAACKPRSTPTTNAPPTTSAPAALGVPMPTGASNMLGKELPLDELGWLNTPGKQAVSLGKVTLVRWWTDTCPYCATSLPAIEQLRKTYADRGLETIAVYHPKPPRDVAAKDVLQSARTIGYDGYVASDLQWKILQRIYLETGDRHSTSVTFLLDSAGIVRYVHPGPIFGPTEDPQKRKQNEDFVNLKAAIEALLGQR